MVVLMEIQIREGRYAPGKLISPRTELIPWIQEYKDEQGNLTMSTECANVQEIRFNKPAASTSFQITLRGALREGEGTEWTIIVPTARMGMLYLPNGFATEQSIMGAVYRLLEPHTIRVLADERSKMPGLTFTVQLLD